MKEKLLRCIVVDDEKHARDLLEHYIQNDDRLMLINSYSAISQLTDSNTISEVDILFLDIEMPGKSGVEYLKEIRPDCKVVFTTAYKDYALEGFNLSVFDYLLKPILEERFQACVDKIHQIINVEVKAVKYEESQNDDFLILKSGYDELKLWVKEILYISAENEYVCFHTTDKKHLIYARLKEIEQELSTTDFIRIHRSYIVAKSSIIKVKTDSVVLKNESEIPVSRSNKSKLDAILE